MVAVLEPLFHQAPHACHKILMGLLQIKYAIVDGIASGSLNALGKSEGSFCKLGYAATNYLVRMQGGLVALPTTHVKCTDNDI